jgi:hypothetical protein
LRWIPFIHYEPLSEALVRVLAATKEEYDARPLVEVFERTKDSSLRWAIANTLSCTKPIGVADWVLKALENPSYGRAREMLCIAAARLAGRERATPILKKIFDEFPGHVALAWRRIGEEEELEFLKSKVTDEKGFPNNEIRKTIASIEKRLKKKEQRKKQKKET